MDIFMKDFCVQTRNTCSDNEHLTELTHIKDHLKKWEDVRTTVLEWHPNQVEAIGLKMSTMKMLLITPEKS